MTTKELIKQVLEKWGFPVLQENESSVTFRYQMNYILANITGSEDIGSIALVFSGLFSADNEKEAFLGLRTCNELNCNLLHAKLYIDTDSDLIIASEFFYKSEEDVEFLLSTGLHSITVAKKRFIERYNELEEEAKLISDLEQE